MTTMDMDDDLTYSGTEQQLRQLALTRARNLLEDEVIWGILVCRLKLDRSLSM